jgi:hypothetical protein
MFTDLKAGASLTPSLVIVTLSPFALKVSTMQHLSRKDLDIENIQNIAEEDVYYGYCKYIAVMKS